ncbi:MAG: guanylate kinase [Desulfobacterales bacterium]|nr:guanylate kinase [Desulfobacterales bacterium]
MDDDALGLRIAAGRVGFMMATAGGFPRAAFGRNGRLFVMSAPSGAGKTTLRQAVLARLPDLGYSISFTTRPPRAGERNGHDYVFIAAEEFEAGIREERWAEWARVHGHYYGTSAQALEEARAAGRDVLLDIDVQGAQQICRRFPESVTIFIMPPSLEVLEQRLRTRGTDRPEAIEVRLRNARREMDQRHGYRHIIVNDDLDTAIDTLMTILNSNRSAREN